MTLSLHKKYKQVIALYYQMKDWHDTKVFSYWWIFSNILSSNIRNDVIRMKCRMKQGANQSNMKIVLDKPENVGWEICLRSSFHAIQFFFIQHDFLFFLLFLCIFVMLDEMLAQLNKAFTDKFLFECIRVSFFPIIFSTSPTLRFCIYFVYQIGRRVWASHSRNSTIHALNFNY